MLWVICLLLLSQTDFSRQQTAINIGVVIVNGTDAPFDIRRVGAAIHIAVEEANVRVLNGTGYTLRVLERGIRGGCAIHNDGAGQTADLFYTENISAVIGPGCAFALEQTARIASHWNIPVLTGLGDGGRFKSKVDYPTLTRFSYCQCRLRKVFGTTFRYYNWTEISIIYDHNDAHSEILGETFKVGLLKGGFFPHVIGYYSSQTDDLESLLVEASARSRVIVLIVNGDDIRRFLLTAKRLGYTDGTHVFMDFEVFPFSGTYYGNNRWQRGDEYDEDAKQSYGSLLRFSLHRPEGENWGVFEARVKNLSWSMYDFDYGNEEVNFLAGAYYDAVMVYANGVKMAASKNISIQDGRALARSCWNQTYEGITGEVIIDDNGDRDTSFAISDLDMETGKFKIVANYWGDRPGYTPVPNARIHWGGQSSGPPPNVPPCGFTGDHPSCQKKEPLSTPAIVMIAMVSVVIPGCVAVLLLYRRYKWEQALKNMSWLVHMDEVKVKKTGARSVATISSMTGGSGSTRGSVGNRYTCQTYTHVAMYKGQIVAVKKCAVEKIPMTRSVLIELKLARSISHDNIIRFIGASVEAKNVAVLTEYGKKGSLQDLLLQDHVTLDWSFKISLLQDLARGMRFIHSSDMRSHGYLTSSNCIIDGRFVLKITDFGLPSFRLHDRADEDQEDARYSKLLCRAPELLRAFVEPSGTPAGDVYSFAIIVEEVTTNGDGPFATASLEYSPKEIIEMVEAGVNPPLRPSLANLDIPQGVVSLAKACWQENPTLRPDFVHIVNAIKPLTRGRENLMEYMLDRMERYATDLESIVDEKTQQWVEEKRKAERLLLQMLPKSIAEQLKQGQSVIPESFKCVTIYFSDIVGFTALSSASTPLQVVDMLNDLYTCFDSVIDVFDVYKVETIGDAYMVASGLPERNGSEHARHITNMALCLLRKIVTFVLRHKPGVQLQLRIGVHSGAVVTGVVGHKMPRYCLFGDTVNTASRMESSGEALRIHISQATCDILTSFGTFLVEPRGEITVKGKGQMQTYWVLESDITTMTKANKAALGLDTDINFLTTYKNNLNKSDVAKN